MKRLSEKTLCSLTFWMFVVGLGLCFYGLYGNTGYPATLQNIGVSIQIAAGLFSYDCWSQRVRKDP